MSENMSEQILTAWLQMTTIINNDKLTETLPFNEAMICRLLYEHRDEPVIASQLCNWMHMKKSQMNRTLTNMENKNYIHRKQNPEDKRKIFIVLNEEIKEIYKKQHDKILQIINSICEELGEEKSKNIVTVFSEIAEIAQKKIEN